MSISEHILISHHDYRINFDVLQMVVTRHPGRQHLSYQFMSRVPFGIYQGIQNENQRQKKLIKRVLLAVSILMMVAPNWPLTELLKGAVTDHQYGRLIVIMTFLAIFLGAYSLNLKLRDAD